MFNCDFCNETSKPRISPTLVVTRVKARPEPYRGVQITQEKKACAACTEDTEIADLIVNPLTGRPQAAFNVTDVLAQAS